MIVVREDSTDGFGVTARRNIGVEHALIVNIDRHEIREDFTKSLTLCSPPTISIRYQPEFPMADNADQRPVHGR